MRKVLFFVCFVLIGSLVFTQWRTMAQNANYGGDLAYLPFATKPEAPLTPVAFLETFDGEPSEPTPWNPTYWDVTVHSRDIGTWFTLQSMDAMHSSACEGPPLTHPINQYEDAVFSCRNHMMTAINAGGYGLIYLTPNHMVDFSEETAVIRFDMSTLRSSKRDWIDIWITPYEENLQLPLEDWLPDLNGEPKNAIHIVMDLADNSFRAYAIINHHEIEIPRKASAPYDQFLDPSPMRRDTFELRVSTNHIKFGMPDYNFWWIDRNITPLDWSQGVVQFGHHSYNPEKDCDFNGTCGPNTWHWDNVSIQPAIPFTIIPADRRYADKNHITVHFQTAAPTGSHLRFAGIGKNIEVSFDGGVSWQDAQQQMQEKDVEGAFASYWTPIPAGASQVSFRGQTWWGGDWQVRDVSIWSLNGN